MAQVQSSPPIVPSVGMTVHYILAQTDQGAGNVRPAIVVSIADQIPNTNSLVNLQVFTDGINDGLDNVEWRTGVSQDATASAQGSWHQ
jgi:hypothetical protein